MKNRDETTGSNTFSVSAVQTGEIPLAGMRMAVYHPETDDLDIWPQGLGRGPVLNISLAGWVRINKEVRLAMVAADRQGGP